jgi:hypothetical protein
MADETEAQRDLEAAKEKEADAAAEEADAAQRVADETKEKADEKANVSE